MKKYSKILYYIFSAVLLVINLIILYTSTFPKVPVEYQIYYISKCLQDWLGYNGLEYKLGDIISLSTADTSAHIKRRGFNWNVIGEDGCRTFGEHASLFFTDVSYKPLYVIRF